MIWVENPLIARFSYPDHENPALARVVAMPTGARVVAMPTGARVVAMPAARELWRLAP
jgi:hypothetical protein